MLECTKNLNQIMGLIGAFLVVGAIDGKLVAFLEDFLAGSYQVGTNLQGSTNSDPDKPHPSHKVTMSPWR